MRKNESITWRVAEPGSEDWSSLAARFPDYPGARSVIVVELERIADSCGWGVPEFEFVGQRTQLLDYSEKLGPEKLAEYKTKKNRHSIDGLPGLPSLSK